MIGLLIGAAITAFFLLILLEAIRDWYILRLIVAAGIFLIAWAVIDYQFKIGIFDRLGNDEDNPMFYVIMIFGAFITEAVLLGPVARRLRQLKAERELLESSTGRSTKY